MRANHNSIILLICSTLVVSNVPKILKWEQITTASLTGNNGWRCFQCSKDTKMRANHNNVQPVGNQKGVVSNVPKILKWEQITTLYYGLYLQTSCFQCSKDTKMRANHNYFNHGFTGLWVVSNVPKILKWEQITTQIKSMTRGRWLFPMFQRY